MNSVALNTLVNSHVLPPHLPCLAVVVDVSVAKAALSPLKTFLLGVLSGTHIAFGAFMILAVGGACPSLANANPGLKQIVSGLFGLPFGLMMTLLSGGELFTGNTAFLATGLVEKKVDWKDVLKNWVFSFAGNFAGAVLIAKLAFAAGTLGDGPAAVATAIAKTSLDSETLFVRGVLCNWLVSLAVYMASGCSTAVSKFVAILFPIAAVITLGLEHSVANMFFVPFGIMRGAKITYEDFIYKNLIPVTLGNIVGGAGCVGLGYSAVFGSLIDRVSSLQRGFVGTLSNVGPSPTRTTPGSPYKVMNIRGGSA